MKKRNYILLGLILLLVGCNSISDLEVIEAENSENFDYSLEVSKREDLKTIKSSGEFLEIKIIIEPKNDYRYKDVNIKVNLNEKIKNILVKGIDKDFETSRSLIIDKNEVYDKGTLSNVFSVNNIEDIKKIENILKAEGLEIIVTWKDGKEKVLVNI